MTLVRLRGRRRSRWWLTGSNIVMIWPSTSIACGTYMSVPSARPMPSATTVLPLPGRAVEEQRLAGVDRRPELVEHPLVDDRVLEAGRQASRSTRDRAAMQART